MERLLKKLEDYSDNLTIQQLKESINIKIEKREDDKNREREAQIDRYCVCV